MAAFVISSRRFDQEWSACVANAALDKKFNMLQALKEGIRDYVSINERPTDIFVKMGSLVYQVSIRCAKTSDGRLRIELSSIRLSRKMDIFDFSIN